MTLLPQPPPNAPAPPPNIQARRSRQKLALIIHLGIVSIILTFLAGIIIPQSLKAQKKSSLTQALSNARQIGLVLYDFDTDYGSFPNDSTIARVKAANQSNWDLKNNTSNDFFKQLIVAKIAISEEIFFAKHHGARKPDNDFSSESQALAAGECGFAYVLGGSTSSHRERPLAVTPLIPGTLRFDPEIHEGYAVVLHSDNSAMRYRILADGRAVDSRGVDIFDSGQPYWNGVPPEVKWPELLPPPPPLPWYREHAFAIGSGLVTTFFLGAGLLWGRHKRKARNHRIRGKRKKVNP